MTTVDAARPGVPKYRRDRAGRQEALKSAALAEFAAKGYSAATTREIALRAGCSEALISRYFGNKQGLLLALMNRFTDIEHGSTPEAIESEDPAEEIRAYLHTRISFVNANPEIYRVYWRQALIDPDLIQAKEAIRSDRMELLRQKLSTHMSAGRLNANTDVTAVARHVIALGHYVSVIMGLAYGVDEVTAHHQIEQWVEQLMDGLRPRPA